MTELSSLKLYVMMHYAEFGQWPTGPAELGLDARTLHSDDVRQVEFQPGGTIAARLAEDFGPDKHLWLIPRETLGGANMSWDCRTDLSPMAFGKVLNSLCKPLGAADSEYSDDAASRNPVPASD